MHLRIKENSFFANLACRVLKSSNVAMVLGKTIHLSGVSREEFLRNQSWVAHELCHVRQFQSYGYLGFLGRYLLESFRNGYYHNKFEVEAREAGSQEAYFASATTAAFIQNQSDLSVDLSKNI